MGVKKKKKRKPNDEIIFFEKINTLRSGVVGTDTVSRSDKPDLRLTSAMHRGEMRAPHVCMNVPDAGSDGASSCRLAGGSQTADPRSRPRGAPLGTSGPLEVVRRGRGKLCLAHDN